MHKERSYIDKIIRDGNDDQMYDLKEVLLTSFDMISMMDKERYKILVDKIYEIAEGKVLNYDRASEIIIEMKPFGMHWNYEETEQVREANGFDDIRPVDFWFVMNMAYNDYHELFKDDIQMYIDYADLFINDEDAKEDKVYIYATQIPR